MPQVPIWVCVLIVLAVAALCGALAFFAGVNHRKREAEAAIGSAEDEAKRIISNAIKTAAAKKKEAVLEGKDEIHRLRNESEKKFSVRSAAFPRRKNLWIKRWKIWSPKKTRSKIRCARRRNA